MTDINIFPDGMMEDGGVNAACWDNPAPWAPTVCTLSKNAAAPHTGLQNLRITTVGMVTASYCYGLFSSQTPGAPGGSFPINSFQCWVKTDVGNSIELKLTTTAGVTTITVSTLIWQLIDFAPIVGGILREGPNGEGVLRVKGIHPPAANEIIEIDDIQARENYIAASSSKGFPDGYACWNCDKFQPFDPDTSRNGECRGLPPAQCCAEVTGDKAEPLFARLILDASAKWCAAWKRRLIKLPDPPPFP